MSSNTYWFRFWISFEKWKTNTGVHPMANCVHHMADCVHPMADCVHPMAYCLHLMALYFFTTWDFNTLRRVHTGELDVVVCANFVARTNEPWVLRQYLMADFILTPHCIWSSPHAILHTPHGILWTSHGIVFFHPWYFDNIFTTKFKIANLAEQIFDQWL